MKKAIFVFLLFTLVLFFAPLSFCETTKIGIFDLQRIMRESKVIEGYRQSMMKEMEPKRKILLEKQESLRQIEERLKKDKGLSPAERKSLEEKFANNLKELRRMAEDIDMEMRKKDLELTQKVLSELGEIIRQIGKKEDYTIILEKASAGVAYLKEGIDITDKILRIYDRRQ